jgi:hypothetical protein
MEYYILLRPLRNVSHRNGSPPPDSSPETFTSGGISSLSRTSPGHCFK